MSLELARQKLAEARPPKWTVLLADAVADLQLPDHGATVFAASLSGELLCAESLSGKLRWRQPHAHRGGTLWCSPRGDGKLLASGGLDGIVSLWDAAKGTPLHSWQAPNKGWIDLGAWSPTGQYLAVTQGRHLYLLNAQGKLQARSHVHDSTILSLAWHPREPRLATGFSRGVAMHQLSQPLPAELPAVEPVSWGAPCLALAWNPLGTWVAGGSADQTVHVWREDRSDHLRMAGYATKLRELTWSRNGKHLHTGGGPVIISWNFDGSGPAGSTPVERLGHGDNITALVAHPRESSVVASTSLDQFLFVWQDGYENPIWVRALPASAALTVRWHPDGNWLYTGSQHGELCGWKVATT